MFPPTVEVYNDIRRQHPGLLLLFRDGDRLAVAADDGPAVAGALGLTALPTSRAFIELPPVDGERLVLDLLVDGHRVAICEPVADAEQPEGRRDRPAPVEPQLRPGRSPRVKAARQLPLFR